MSPSIRQTSAAIAAFLIAAAPALAETATIALAKGGSVRGELISDSADRLVVDLGFTVLTIPRAETIAVSREKTAPSAPETFGADLFRTAAARPEGSVKDVSAEVAEAVALIRTPTGLGSGFVIHPDGFVITNNHVIAGENEVMVTLFEGSGKNIRRTEFTKVRIVAASPENDLALLKLETAAPRTFKTVPIADHETLRQGATVFAIGSPAGLERSASAGIVSLRNRLIDGRLYIQTTAAINPGNSGGPLFNLRGEVVGVNNMKLASVGLEGLGFAIPSDTLKTFLRNRDAFAFDPRNPNAGYRYATPPGNEAPATTAAAN